MLAEANLFAISDNEQVDMIKRLSELEPDEIGQVIAVKGGARFSQRLMAMGITPGTNLVVRKFAPLGDPIEIRVRDYSLSIRRKDAFFILVKQIKNDSAS